MIVLRSSSTDVFENLAAEDALLDDDRLTVPAVMVYRNHDAVVLGKNQNPWRECAVGRLAGLGVALARRISGGGTVYHDAGNLNVSCFLPRELYRRDEALGLFRAGFARAGISTEIANGTSLVAQGLKLSGQAFCYRRDKVLHHATLLWEANLERLRTVLVPDHPGLETRAVASVRMPVVNGRILCPDLDAEAVTGCLLGAMAATWGPAVPMAVSPFDVDGFADRVARMRSWEWVYGSTPDFRVRVDGRWREVHRGRDMATGEKFQ